MEDLLNLIGEHHIKFCWIDKSTVGSIDPSNDVIKISPYLLIAETLMHEMVHCQFPRLDEVETERRARSRIQRMTVKEIKRMVDFAIILGGKLC